MMTRKDYIATAEILKSFSEKLDSKDFNDLVFEFGELFLEDNKNFSSEKFELACYGGN